jgi:hypothetical protein
MIRKSNIIPEFPEIPEEPPAAEESVILGVNITWFNTWNESQPLANVFHQARTSNYAIPSTDEYGNISTDFSVYIYEGNNPGGIPSGSGGGSQFGEHLCKFNGSASTISGATIGNKVYNSETNTTTFTYTTTSAINNSLTMSGTKKTAESETNTGITNLQIMRPDHTFTDFVNKNLVDVMEPFGCFRVGPNWDDFTYATTAPTWSERAKPGGIFYGGVNGKATAPWETLIKMANEMQVDLWICIPAIITDEYLTKIFQIFMYGSDGNDPYTSTQANPVWEPLDSNLKLYFEMGNEVWNSAPPFGSLTDEMHYLALAEVEAGDANHYLYPGSSYNFWYGVRRRLGYLTVMASNLCRSIVGDDNMMTRFRPVISGQAADTYKGNLSLSYIRCVYGGYDWYTAWLSGHFPGEYKNLISAEDGVTENQFGIVARPITYYVYGYAIAPYVNGDTIEELNTYYNNYTAGWITKAINLCNGIGIEPLCYEGGIEIYSNYTDEGMEGIIENLLNYWFNNGGKLFCYYSLAGNSGSGLVPDLTKTDPAIYPKIKAIRDVKGLV